MSIILKHITRNILENKFRSIVIILIIILSTSTTLIVFSLQDIATYTYDKIYNASKGEADITIQKDETGRPYNPDILSLSSGLIEKRADMYYLSGKYDTSSSVTKVVLIGMDIKQYQNMDSVALLSSVDEFQLNAGECIISKMSSENYGLSIGEYIIIKVNEQPHKFKITALGETNRTFYEEKGNFQVLITLEDANNIANTTNMVSKTRVKVADTTNVSEAVTVLKNQYQEFSIYEGEEFEALHFQFEAVSSAMFVVVAIVVLVGIYILFAIVKLIMTDRIAVIGIFKCVGADQKKVTKILLMEFLSYGVIGSIVGIIISIPILPLVSEIFNQYKEFGVKSEVVYRPQYILISMMIGLFLPVISAFFNVLKTSKRPLKEIILKSFTSVTRKTASQKILPTMILAISGILYFFNKADNMFIGFLCLFLLIWGAALITPGIMTLFSLFITSVTNENGSFTMGVKSLRNNKAVRGNGSMLVVILLIILLAGNLIAGIKNVAATDIESYGFDIIVTINKEGIRAEDFKLMDGVDDAYDSYESICYGDYATGFARIFGVENFNELNQYMTALSYLDSDLDEKINMTENAVIVDEYWARVQKIQVGDSIALYSDNKRNNKIADFTVTGFWDSSKGTTDRAFIAISLDSFKKLIIPIPDRILIKSKDSAFTAKKIAEEYIDTNVAAITTNAYISEQLVGINNLINILIVAVGIAAIVVVLGIVSNLLVSFIQRKREYAILYSVCMSERQLAEMIFWEMMASFIVIFVIVFTADFVLVKYLHKASSGLGMVIDFNFNPLFTLSVLGITGILLVITSIFPINQMKKINILEELKYE